MGWLKLTHWECCLKRRLLFSTKSFRDRRPFSTHCSVFSTSACFGVDTPMSGVRFVFVWVPQTICQRTPHSQLLPTASSYVVLSTRFPIQCWNSFSRVVGR